MSADDEGTRRVLASGLVALDAVKRCFQAEQTLVSASTEAATALRDLRDEIDRAAVLPEELRELRDQVDEIADRLESDTAHLRNTYLLLQDFIDSTPDLPRP